MVEVTFLGNSNVINPHNLHLLSNPTHISSKHNINLHNLLGPNRNINPHTHNLNLNQCVYQQSGTQKRKAADII
jgi:hypothetical protein